TDEGFYKSRLQYEIQGAKANPIHLTGLNSKDTNDIGNFLIRLYKTWKPENKRDDMDDMNAEQKIGSLYGFGLHIRRQREAYEEKGIFEYRFYNTYYAQRAENGIKYTYNHGIPNVDNPKLAARHFLNAIDRVESLKNKYQKTLHELEQNIPIVMQIVGKPFEREDELQQM